jgi:hypothetical protein
MPVMEAMPVIGSNASDWKQCQELGEMPVIESNARDWEQCQELKGQ